MEIEMEDSVQQRYFWIFDEDEENDPLPNGGTIYSGYCCKLEDINNYLYLPGKFIREIILTEKSSIGQDRYDDLFNVVDGLFGKRINIYTIDGLNYLEQIGLDLNKLSFSYIYNAIEYSKLDVIKHILENYGNNCTGKMYNFMSNRNLKIEIKDGDEIREYSTNFTK
jgi:hypothetical protein